LKTIRLCHGAGMTILFLGIFCSQGEPQTRTSSPTATTSHGAEAHVPAKAVDVYHYVLRTGKAPEGYVGGRVWQNREHRLPSGGGYREYDVNPKIHGKDRGPERIIVDQKSGKGWYTADHYRTFTRITH